MPVLDHAFRTDQLLDPLPRTGMGPDVEQGGILFPARGGPGRIQQPHVQVGRRFHFVARLSENEEPDVVGFVLHRLTVGPHAGQLPGFGADGCGLGHVIGVVAGGGSDSRSGGHADQRSDDDVLHLPPYVPQQPVGVLVREHGGKFVVAAHKADEASIDGDGVLEVDVGIDHRTLRLDSQPVPRQARRAAVLGSENSVAHRDGRPMDGIGCAVCESLPLVRREIQGGRDAFLEPLQHNRLRVRGHLRNLHPDARASAQQKRRENGLHLELHGSPRSSHHSTGCVVARNCLCEGAVSLSAQQRWLLWKGPEPDQTVVFSNAEIVVSMCQASKITPSTPKKMPCAPTDGNPRLTHEYLQFACPPFVAGGFVHPQVLIHELVQRSGQLRG